MQTFAVMTKTSSFLRVSLAIALILAGVIWAVSGLLLLAAALRGQGLFGEHGTPGTILLIILWVAGMFAFIGGAVALVRTTFQTSSDGSAATRSRDKNR
jgi:hypothetical protein